MTEPKKKPIAPDAPILNVAEAALLLRVTDRHLYRLAREGQGPRQIRIGRRVVYRRVDLLAWVDSKVK